MHWVMTSHLLYKKSWGPSDGFWRAQWIDKDRGGGGMMEDGRLSGRERKKEAAVFWLNKELGCIRQSRDTKLSAKTYTGNSS